MRVMVVYDVSDDKRRLRLSRTLERWGLARIQRSAFTGVLQPARVRDLERLVRTIVDPSTDIVHILPVQDQDWRRVRVIGRQWGESIVHGATLLK
ncbi:MAG: CRISPR-associated endonuclease Cas2 [Desulfurococcales archaeon]|nr:CRISPR-associated endonuclease Cas2 [Desulfurococcales archaeon]